MNVKIPYLYYCRIQLFTELEGFIMIYKIRGAFLYSLNFAIVLLLLNVIIDLTRVFKIYDINDVTQFWKNFKHTLSIFVQTNTIEYKYTVKIS
jgi:hypothetical protein